LGGFPWWDLLVLMDSMCQLHPRTESLCAQPPLPFQPLLEMIFQR
jgi:hypothetical protein